MATKNRLNYPHEIDFNNGVVSPVNWNKMEKEVVEVIDSNVGRTIKPSENCCVHMWYMDTKEYVNAGHIPKGFYTVMGASLCERFLVLLDPNGRQCIALSLTEEIEIEKWGEGEDEYFEHSWEESNINLRTLHNLGFNNVYTFEMKTYDFSK